MERSAMKRYLPFGLLFAALVTFALPLPAGENEGQDDLDKATEKKLSAESLDDLSEVLRLCESAMKKGLSPDNNKFADNLYTSTLFQRGRIYTGAIFENKDRPNPAYKQLREKALADLEKVVSRDPKSGEAELMIAKLQALDGGDRDKALKAADQAVSLISKTDEPALAAAALVVRASVLDNPDKQQADLDEAIKLQPEDLEALRTRALFFIGTKKFEQALKDLDTLIRIDDKNPRLYEVRGMVLFQLKQPDKAIESYNKAIQMQPGEIGPYIQRSRIRAQQKDNKGALEDLDTALRINPENTVVLLARARLYQKMGDLKNAKADVEEALKNQPALPVRTDAWALKAAIAAGAGDIEEAIVDLEQLLKIMPKNPELLLQIGELYSQIKQPSKAIEKYNAALAYSEKKEYQIYEHRGDAYLNVGKHAEAIKDYEQTMKLKPSNREPTNWHLLNNFAWVLATSPDDKIRDGKRALKMATDACEETKYNDPTILSTLAAAYAETGDFDNASKYSSKAVEAADLPDNQLDDKNEMANIKEQLRKELENYKQKKPTRELLSEEDAAKDRAKKASDGDGKSSETKKPEEKKSESVKKTDEAKNTGEPKKADETKKSEDSKKADDNAGDSKKPSGDKN
jgi:tetratricopeptide (TPR) repeat protein